VLRLGANALAEALMITRLIAVCALVSLAGCGPFVVFPGGKLDGVTTRAPDDGSFTADVSTVQLETRPEDPYSVNIWAVGMGPALYLHAGANRATWVENIEADPNVQIRVDDRLYPLRASRVQSQEEFDRFSDAYEQKYDVRPRNENVTEAYLFRLDAP
jgi:hypothetical protein